MVEPILGYLTIRTCPKSSGGFAKSRYPAYTVLTDRESMIATVGFRSLVLLSAQCPCNPLPSSLAHCARNCSCIDGEQEDQEAQGTLSRTRSGQTHKAIRWSWWCIRSARMTWWVWTDPAVSVEVTNCCAPGGATSHTPTIALWFARRWSASRRN